MSRPTFDQLPVLWEDDGSLRDVLFTDIGPEGWSRFIRFVSLCRLTYKSDGEEAEFPGVLEIFNRRDRSHCLSIRFGEAIANCHFFLEDEIELDLSPREVLGQIEHNAILDFIEQAALAVGANASLMPEGDHKSPFMVFDVRAKMWKI